MAQSPDFFLESDTNAEELANITAVLFNPALRIGYPIIAVLCAALRWPLWRSFFTSGFMPF